MEMKDMEKILVFSDLHANRRALMDRIPNYLCPLEQYYKIYWIPMLPKPLAKIFLKLRGRPSDFIEDINYITPSKLVKTLKSYDMEINDMTLPVNYQITKRKSLKGNLISILGKVFDGLGINQQQSC